MRVRGRAHFMEAKGGMGMLKNIQIIVLGVCIACATIASSVILSQGFLKITKFTREQITVTGSAHKNIKSDFIVWKGSFSRRDADISNGYRRLKEDMTKVKAYLFAQGIADKEAVFSPIGTTTLYRKNEKGNDTNDIQWYVLTQAVEVRSAEVDKVTELSRESTELINKGVEFSSEAPEYTYTRLDELKVEMLSMATENAKQRAENMVRATGNRIGVMRSARMGVFQVTPLHSTEVSDWGVNDTTSLEKKVTAVVSVSFAIE
jgi:uncharacterized protein